MLSAGRQAQTAGGGESNERRRSEALQTAGAAAPQRAGEGLSSRGALPALPHAQAMAVSTRLGSATGEGQAGKGVGDGPQLPGRPAATGLHTRPLGPTHTGPPPAGCRRAGPGRPPPRLQRRSRGRNGRSGAAGQQARLSRSVCGRAAAADSDKQPTAASGRTLVGTVAHAVDDHGIRQQARGVPVAAASRRAGSAVDTVAAADQQQHSAAPNGSRPAAALGSTTQQQRELED